MELKFNATIELKPADVEGLIKNYILSTMQGFTVESVHFETGQDYDRFDRPCGIKFTGVKIKVRPVKEHDGRGPG